MHADDQLLKQANRYPLKLYWQGGRIHTSSNRLEPLKALGGFVGFG